MRWRRSHPLPGRFPRGGAGRRLILFAMIVAGVTLWLSLERSRPGHSPPAGAPGSDEGLLARGDERLERCEGWPAEAALDPATLERFASDGWLALAAGRPDRAIEAFRAQPGLSGEDRLGLLRAKVEWARALWTARAVMLTAQRHFLETRLEALPDVVGRELYPFLRAAVALQAGEPVEVTPWLAQVPDSSPLAAAREVLRRIAREPLSSRQPEAEALRRWRRHAGRYAAALEKIACPYPGAAATRARVLEDWAKRDTLPPPERWAAQLETDRPDFDLGRCEGEEATLRADLYDSSPWTVVAALALEEAVRTTETSPGARYFRLQALVALEPAEARAEACRLLNEWPDGPDRRWELAALIYGDQEEPRAMRAGIERLCAGEREPCPAEADNLRARLDAGMARAEHCYRTIAREHGPAGDFAKRYQLYGGILRRQLLAPVLEGSCPLGLADQALRLWEGQRVGGTPWQSLEATLWRARVDAEAGHYQDGVAVLATLAGSLPLFSPVFETARRAGGITPSEAAEQMLEN